MLATGPGVVAFAQPGGFGDVAGDAYYSEPVAALAAMGVFAGTECDAGFCPDGPIDRKTMAVWVVRVLDGSDPAPTFGTGSRFVDVNRILPVWWVRFIERMAELGVTQGCGDGTNFCPNDSVARAQMAVFLSRAYNLAAGPDPGFSDVAADAWYAPDVARLAASGITQGCGDGTVFCPGRHTTRAQMATFLWRAGNRSEPAPAPAGLEVVQQEVLDSSGGVVEAGGTVVRVPAGAVDEPVQVEIREPLGVFGTEEGGAVVGIEHQGPLAAPVTVAWDVGHLSDDQRHSILLVRWDDGLSQWLSVDVDYETAAGVLTAEIQQWSWVTWITDLAANTSQTIQEILRRRVDAPKCSGELPEWVTSAAEPDEGANAAAIRLCYEPRDSEAVTMRMANNRVFSQFVYSDTPGAWGDTVEEGPLPQVSLEGVLHQVASRVFSDDTRVFMPPLTQAAVAIERPQGPVEHTITFHRRNTAETFLGDVMFFVVDKLPTPTGTAAVAYTQVYLTVLLECAAPKLVEYVSSDASVLKNFFAAVGATLECVGYTHLPHTPEHTKLTQELAKKSLSVPEFKRSFGEETVRGLKGALRALWFAEAIGYFIDLAADDWIHSSSWSIKVQGRIASFGDWKPTCSDADEDSNRLYLNLVVRPPFTPAPDRATLGGLRTFDSWRPSAEAAVAPLKACGDSLRAQVAADIDDTWHMETADKAIVRDLILEMLAPDPTGGYSAITAGDSHTCALSANQAVICWGDNTYGQLHEIDGQYSAIAAGARHTCGTRTNGTVECWGEDTDDRKLDAPDGQYRAITAGRNHSCAIGSDKAVKCWGGYVPVIVEREKGVHADSREGPYSDVAAGWAHTCAIRSSDNTIECWGTPSHGQLEAPVGEFRAIAAGFVHTCAIRSSDNTIECWGSYPETTEAPTGEFRAIAAGSQHTCALRTNDTITCWGSTSGTVGPHGQLDAPDDHYSAVAAGEEHSCAIRTDQTITCWGNNDHGQTNAPGDTGGTAPDTTTPPPTAASNAVDAGGGHTCGLKTDNTITCWGDNSRGQADAPNGTFTAVTAGENHTCGLKTDNTVTCWGYNSRGQADAPNGTFTAVAAGGNHTCGLKTDNTVTCWGYNRWGQADAPNGTFTAVAAGGNHTCGLKTDATVTCWGYNSWRQADAPNETFTAVAAGWGHTCGVKTNATVTCWGLYSAGQADAPNGTFTAVTAGEVHTCGLKTDNTITCWGDNSRGQADAPNGTFTAVDAGAGHTCGVKTDATVTCWGYNSWGQAVAPSGTFTAVTAIGNWTCGLKTDNTVTCWGEYDHGQTDPTDGTFTIGLGEYALKCGPTTNKTVTCWPLGVAGQAAPDGPFTTITYGQALACGLKTDATIACWGLNNYGRADAPAGTFTTIDSGAHHVCGVRTNATITCWGRNNRGQTDPPSGTFTAVTAGGNHTCGLRTNGTITCWGNHHYGQADTPDEFFTTIASPYDGWSHFTCGLRTNGTITCWGGYGRGGPPDGTFTAITVAENLSCGLRSNGTIACWNERLVQRGAPDGTFTAVTAGGNHACGLRTNGTITCWGSESTQTADPN